MSNVEQLLLWKLLETDQQRVTVRKLVEYASPILDRVVETFPTYTLHNSQHAENVARIMAELLGPRVKDLASLEAAMLILSAYFHDIGMVFKIEEKEGLRGEQEWQEFLDEYPEAYVAMEKDGITPNLAEWYCRWRHADRVFVYLNDQELDEHLQWGVISIRKELGVLCRSHNEDPKKLAENRDLKTNFRQQTDLKFCAILLRLADILDFDHSRSPNSVYQFLGLSRRETKGQEQSDVEWRKHLSSEGFFFPPDSERSAPYELSIIAAPDNPAVEHDVRQFLDLIDGELEGCAALLGSCSERWRSFILPARINRHDIQSNGYSYGNYRFALEQNQVLDLLVGESLYENPYTFVRELLQNAIDTTRHRCYAELARGDARFEPESIRISEWCDEEGYQWVGFDDFGMGMDEEIMRNYLLKVGSSYYNTARFKADLLRAQQQLIKQKKAAPDFKPISRFGIGLLSCFIASDRMEISSLHQNPNGGVSKPIRLSLNGLHGFYTFQTPELRAVPMPVRRGRQCVAVDYLGYRREFGTSVAVRLDPRKEKGPFKLKELLTQYVLCPPVPIEFNGERLGGDPGVLVDRPWCERQTIPLTPAEIESLEQLLCYKFREPLQIDLFSLDLTKHSPVPELKGQFLTIAIRPNLEWQQLEKIVSRFGELKADLVSDSKTGVSLHISLEIKKKRLAKIAESLGRSRDAPVQIKGLPLEFSSTLLDLYRRVEPSDAPESSEALIQLDWICELSTALRERMKLYRQDNSSWLSHNGITIPFDPYLYHFNSGLGRVGVTWGVVTLADSLRPDLSISRDVVRELPWRILSSGTLALYRASANSILGLNRNVEELPEYDRLNLGKVELFGYVSLSDGRELWRTFHTLGEILDDECIKVDTAWGQMPIISVYTDGRHCRLTLKEIKALLNRGHHLELMHRFSLPVDAPRNSASVYFCAEALIQVGLNVSARLNKYIKKIEAYVFLPEEPPRVREGQKLFPPLMFLPFSGSSLFCDSSTGRTYNQGHPFSQWLIETAPLLAEKYPGILNQIRSLLLGWSVPTSPRDINQALERLHQLDPDLSPESLYLKPEDFGASDHSW